ncbi:MAG: dienelactone hydrolase family protein [Kofleriaceae bacterium]
MKALVLVVLLACHSSPHETCGAPTTATAPAGVRTIQFPAGDGVTVTADVYAPLPATAPFIVLFHQAGYSRGEYRTIAPRLNQLGFNAMAVDARSGEATGGVGNETAASACKLGKPTNYVDAIADLKAAVAQARTLAQGKLLVWGSSYSSALVLVLGTELHADAVLSFSPGEYFDDQGKSKTWVAEHAKTLTVPVFITSAHSEAGEWAPIAAAIDPAKLTTFVPATAGHHGSSTLWPTQPDREASWTAVTAFLKPFVAP